MGDEAFARLEGVSAKFHAVREKNILDDPRLAAMIGQDRVDYFKNNVHYVRTERARATPEELAKMEADRAAFRRENKGDDDVTAAMLALIEKTGGRGGGIGNSTWGHALEGSVRDVKDRLASTWRNDTRLMAAMERINARGLSPRRLFLTQSRRVAEDAKVRVKKRMGTVPEVGQCDR